MKYSLLFICIFLAAGTIPKSVITRCNQNGLVTLTFDDGVNNQYESILNILKSYNIPATFFIIGKTLEQKKNSDLLLQSAKQGHTLGNHTWNHFSIIKLSEEDLLNEVLLTQEYLPSSERYFRPPYGKIDAAAFEVLSALNFKTILWNMDLKDWDRKKSLEQIWASFLNNIESADAAKDSFIILLHVTPNTVKLLPLLIPKIQEKGFQIVPLSQCVD